MKKAFVTILVLLAGAFPTLGQRTPSAVAVADTSDRPKIDVESYTIEITLSPGQGLKGTADVRLRQLDRMSYVTFDLDSRLKIDKVTVNGSDARFRQFDFDNTVEVTLSNPQSEASTLHFEYAGFLDPDADKRVPVLASISEDSALLLYEGKWFPTSGLYKDKAAASLKVNAPAGWTVLSDLPGSGTGFASQIPSFWGLVAAGKFTSASVKTERGEVAAHTLTAKSVDVEKIAGTAGKALDFYAATFGPAEVSKFQIIEAPKVNWPSRWASGVLLMSSTQFRPDFDVPALTRSLAHQWFPLKVSVADPTRDAWLVDGMAVFASLLYAEKNLSPAEAQEQIDKALVKALASESDIAVREAGKLDREAPDYRALVEYKGGFILRMLQWVVGDEKFNQILTRYVERFQNTPASTDAFVKLASDTSGQDLEYFFDQWLNETGVPEMKQDSIVYRIKNGYKIEGEVKQDLDLFRMPVELEISTDGEPDYKRVDVS